MEQEGEINNNTNEAQGLSLKQKIEKATMLKEQGNELYKKQKYYDAISPYKEGLELLYGCGLSSEARELMLTINLNMCFCLNQLGAYEQCIERMNFSIKLRTDHPKIYYYRGIAYVNTGKFEEAEKDYDKLFELLPSKDPALTILRKLIDEKKPKTEKEPVNTNIYKSFLKSNLYEDEVPKARKDNDSDSEDEKETVNRIKVWD